MRINQAAGVMFIILSIGCAKKVVPKSPKDIIYSAKQDMKNGEFKDARKKLTHLEDNFPGSEMLAQTRLLEADSFFKEGRWDEAVVKYQTFLDLHPTHHYADRAQLFIVKCYVEKLENKKEIIFFKSSIIDRDLAPVYSAMEEAEKFFKVYPYSKYMPQAKKIHLRCKEILAENQYYIGKFYLKTDYYAAAVGRFVKILNEYHELPKMREKAYFYLGESYWRWNRKTESVAILKSFLKEYPSSQFANMAVERIGMYK